MTDERFLDIRDKVNSIEYRDVESDDREELVSYETFLNKEIDRYYGIFDKIKEKGEDIVSSKKMTEGVKNKLTEMLSLLYRIEELLNLDKL